MLVDWLEVSPPLDSAIRRYMLETVDVRLRVKTPHSPDVMRIQVWTHLPTQIRSDGSWYAIDIPYLGQAADSSLVFQHSLRPTSPGHFELTYRAYYPSTPELVQWIGPPHYNAYLQVAPPSDQAEWTQRPNPVEIMPGVYVGNFMAASQAESLGFDAVLNMAEELNPTFANDGAIAYLKLPCTDGSQHPIPAEYLHRAVAWIEQQRAAGKQRVLVHCRAGIGRSGSVGIAYCFYKHSEWSYTQTLDYIWSKKPDIYPHDQLQNSLEQLYRNDTGSN